MRNSQHPVLAVVDRGDNDTVIWHVQTDPAAASVLSGAWIVTDDARGLLDEVRVVDSFPQLDAIADAVEADVDTLRRAARKAKADNPSLTLPRFDDLDRPSPADVAGTFHGEPRAEKAWSLAVGLAEIVGYWHNLESARRQRAYLADEFGREVRPLPVPAADGS